MADEEPIDRQIFNWWMLAHQRIIKKMIYDTPYKIKYYGGFAVNLALGCREMPSALRMQTCYDNGYAISKHHASDIDAKILGFRERGREGRFVQSLLERLSGGNNITTLSYDIQEIVIREANLPSDQIYIVDKPTAHSPIEYVLGYSKFFMVRPGEGGSQLILLGVYTDTTGAVKTQVLSELTPTPEEAPEGREIFYNTDLATLRNQFKALEDYLALPETRNASGPSGPTRRRRPGNTARKAKTTARIAAINAYLLKQAATAAATRGGSVTRRRRRRSVKP